MPEELSLVTGVASRAAIWFGLSIKSDTPGAWLAPEEQASIYDLAIEWQRSGRTTSSNSSRHRCDAAGNG